MNYKKIADVAKELQTDSFKMKIYRMIEKFVYKYHTRYYPHYKGELHDLILDLFDKFVVPKKHRNGEVFSELDRVEPSKVGGGEWTGSEDKAIATYVQRFVINRLIDLERSDKKEVSATENYDSDKGGLTLDRAAMGGKRSQGDDGMVSGSYVENINYEFFDLMDNPQAVRNARKSLVENPDQVKRIKRLLKHYRKDLDPQVVEFIEKLLGEEEEPIAEVAFDDLESKYDAKIVKYNLQSKPAVKVSFSSKDEMNSKDLGAAKKDFKEKGYTFYKAHGSNWYFFKDTEVGDSIITDGKKVGGIDPRTGKRMTREEALNYDGPIRKFVSFEAYKKDNPVEGIDFTWVDQNGNDLPDFHAVSDSINSIDEFDSRSGINHFDNWETHQHIQKFISDYLASHDVTDEDRDEVASKFTSVQDFVNEYELSEDDLWFEITNWLSADKKKEFLVDFNREYGLIGDSLEQ